MIKLIQKPLRKHIRKTYYILIGFFFFFSFSAFPQDQKLADSLRQIYESLELTDSMRLEILRRLSFNENDQDLGLEYAEELIRIAEKQRNDIYLFHGNLKKGYKMWKLGKLEEALEVFISAIKAAERAECPLCEGTAYCAIADLYSESHNHANAMSYYIKAISILRKTNDRIALATTILNAGDEYLTYKNYDSALLLFKESKVIFDQTNYKIGKAYTLGNIGMVYANTNKNDLAEKNINEAIQILEKSENFYPICFYLISMSDIYEEKGDRNEALKYADRSLQLARQYKLKQQISDANLKLSELYEELNKPDMALKYYKNYIVYRDSVNNLETIQSMADQRTAFEVNLREKEINTLEQEKQLHQTYVFIAIILLILSIVVLLYFRQRFLTSRLLAANERKQHDMRVKDLLIAQETKALQSMVQGKEQERRRLAQELHNHLGSLMATVKVNLNGLESPDKAKHNTITGLVDRACQDVRNISHELNMGVSEGFGLIPALNELTRHLQSNGLMVEFTPSMGKHQIDAENEIVLYRIIQELVSNVLKHAQATKLYIYLTYFEEESLVNIIVEDNGKGFDKTETKKASGGMGLNSLKEMVEGFQGDIKFDSTNKGTTVNIDLPIDSPTNLDEL